MHKGNPSPSDLPEKRRAYYLKNRERILANRKNHKPKKKCSEYDKYLDWRYKYRYGITYQEYLGLEAKQNGVCALCKQPETQVDTRRNKLKRLAVDHSHETGTVRGLLCHECNTGLGKFKDSPALLKAAIKYLKESS